MSESNKMLDISGFLQGLEIELPKYSSTLENWLIILSAPPLWALSPR